MKTLPKVWVVWTRGATRMEAYVVKDSAVAHAETWGLVVPYAPVQKPKVKVCVWTVGRNFPKMPSASTGCDAATAYRRDYSHCYYCGGKIKIKETR